MNYLNNNPIIIGIEHGYGNIKTAHTCFRTGVTVHDRESTFKNDLLIYEGRYYTIGEGHKEFAADKMSTAGATAYPTCPTSSSGNPCATRRPFSLPTR